MENIFDSIWAFLKTIISPIITFCIRLKNAAGAGRGGNALVIKSDGGAYGGKGGDGGGKFGSGGNGGNATVIGGKGKAVGGNGGDGQ
jgi:hypothetical protein